MFHSEAGFTIVELVVVMVLIGIVATYAAPRFSGRGGFTEMAARQDIKQSIRYAQQLAMSQTDQLVIFSTTASTIDVKIGASAATAVDAPLPDGNGIYPKPMDSDIALTNGITLTFDRFGSASTDALIAITGPVSTLYLCVNGITGYASDNATTICP